MTAITAPSADLLRSPVSRRQGLPGQLPRGKAPWGNRPRRQFARQQAQVGQASAQRARRADVGAMANRPCRMHDGKSIGLRMPEWFPARLDASGRTRRRPRRAPRATSRNGRGQAPPILRTRATTVQHRQESMRRPTSEMVGGGGAAAGVGIVSARGRGTASLGRHPMQRANGGIGCGGGQGGVGHRQRGGTPRSDDTPCNGRWWDRMWRRPGRSRASAAGRDAALGRHPIQRAMVGSDVAAARVGSGIGSGEGRRARTTPHATGDGGIGCGDGQGGVVHRQRGGSSTSDDTPCNGRMVGSDVAAAREGSGIGRGGGSPTSDDTPYNGRWWDRIWRRPERSLHRQGGGSPRSDDTPYNGRPCGWAARMRG